MATYFATDGNYGFADDIVIVDTREWTYGDWMRIEEASDGGRAEVAAMIASEYKADELARGGNNG